MVALFILLLDLSTKALAASSYGLGEKHHFLFVSILHLQNPGVSLGLFSQLGLIGNGVQLPLYAFAIAALFGSIGVLLKAADSPLFWFPAGLVLGGLGNVIELAYHGYGTDFIYISGLNGSANLADFAIFTGIGLFLLLDLCVLAFALAKKHRNVVVGSSLS